MFKVVDVSLTVVDALQFIKYCSFLCSWRHP